MTAKDLIQKPCSFIHEGKELVGMIVECVETVPFGPGEVPDFLVTVRGSSGRTMTVSLCKTYLKPTDL